jgi:riboflavin kinase/FMN adenylyltransferase
MKIFQSGFEAGKWAPGAVVTIGKFDGIHLGHQEIIRRALAKAAAIKTRCLVVTFDPTPDQFLRLYSYKPILSPAQRIEILGQMGVDAIVLLPFTNELACLSPDSFTRMILVDQLKVSDIYIGEDFCFGKNRAGDVETLEELSPKMGFKVHPVSLIRVDGEKVSASRIRQLIEQGEMSKAEKLLGRELKAS